MPVETSGGRDKTQPHFHNDSEANHFLSLRIHEELFDLTVGHPIH